MLSGGQKTLHDRAAVQSGACFEAGADHGRPPRHDGHAHAPGRLYRVGDAEPIVFDTQLDAIFSCNEHDTNGLCLAVIDGIADRLLRNPVEIARDRAVADRYRVTFYLGNFYERDQADLLAVLQLPSVALSVPGARGGDAAVVGGAQERHDRIAAHAAGDHVAGGGRQVPRRVGVHRHRARC